MAELSKRKLNKRKHLTTINHTARETSSVRIGSAQRNLSSTVDPATSTSVLSRSTSQHHPRILQKRKIVNGYLKTAINEEVADHAFRNSFGNLRFPNN
jgi:hypothetical protein